MPRACPVDDYVAATSGQKKPLLLKATGLPRGWLRSRLQTTEGIVFNATGLPRGWLRSRLRQQEKIFFFPLFSSEREGPRGKPVASPLAV